jgi:hypothetical protein
MSPKLFSPKYQAKNDKDKTKPPSAPLGSPTRTAPPTRNLVKHIPPPTPHILEEFDPYIRLI